MGIFAQVGYVLATWLSLGRASIYYYHPLRLKEGWEYEEELRERRPYAILREFVPGFLAIFVCFVIGAGFMHFALEVAHSNCDYSISGWTPFTAECSELEDSSLAGKIGTTVTFSYFSLATITTTGFGDIYPRTPWARAVTAVEIMLNLLFITIVLHFLLT